jgi:hypothetical protein
MKQNKPVRLENWSIVNLTNDPYKAPEQQKVGLHGRVFGHDRHAEGAEVSTSSIVSVLKPVVKTKSGTEYILGEIDPEFEKAFPNAAQRFWKSAEQQYK